MSLHRIIAECWNGIRGYERYGKIIATMSLDRLLRASFFASVLSLCG
jgi:hypothetical protein